MKTICLVHHIQTPDYTGKALLPVSEELDFSGEVMVEIHKNRNPGNHRRYFAFLKTSFDMQDHYEDPEVWRKVLQLMAGFFDEVVGDKGNLIYLPRSIEWSKLDELEFRDLFGRGIVTGKRCL